MSFLYSTEIRARLINSLFKLGCVAILGFYLLLTISANIDLIDGRFALFMDEKISFDGVKKILHPTSTIAFFDSVLIGRDFRYGRSLWNSIAIFAAIPERIFGDSGQIFAARMLQVILIIGSYCVFAFGILRSWYLRTVLLVVILTLPFSEYFMTMPKPEPLQLFFLALFSYFYYKNNAKFSWHWIFIGLAFGTKISTLPALFAFTIITVLTKDVTESTADFNRKFLTAFKAFAIGLAIAVPVLFFPICLIVLSLFIFNWACTKFNLNRLYRVCLSLLMNFIVIAGSYPILKIWISSTFLNTTHGEDLSSVNFLSWFHYFIENWLVAPHFISLTFIILIAFFLIANYIILLSSKNIIFDSRITALAIAFAGLSLNIAIYIGSKRLWGFYLYPGMILILVGTLMLADCDAANLLKNRNQYLLKLNIYLRNLIVYLLLLISIFYWMPQSVRQLETLSQRTKSLEFASQYSAYKSISTFLDNYDFVGDKVPPIDIYSQLLSFNLKQIIQYIDRSEFDQHQRLRVAVSPLLFYPESNEKYIIKEFWGPYNSWEDPVDVLILSLENTPRGMLINKESPNFKQFLIERAGYLSNVVDKGANCLRSPCYVRELILENGGEILVLKKIHSSFVR